MMVCGVDDAGRGSMLGPLVIAGVCLQNDQMSRLKEMGVRDSKKHTPAARKRLSRMIREVADSYHVVHVPPRSIDASVRQHGLNRLEARYMARVISKLGPDSALVDSCDTDTARFGRRISRMSGNCRVGSYHHADSRFVIVSAASILAKVARDDAIGRLARNNPGIGSGYPSDRRSVSFLRSYYKKNHAVPSYARKSWKPVKRLLGARRAQQ
ncbi:MAG: ribonuclease HII [Nitrosopumilaceae archaeon]|nr:ribonuclease HII [Nitrosopumilaceae archaeon]